MSDETGRRQGNDTPGGHWLDGPGDADPEGRRALLAMAVSATGSGILITAPGLPDNPIIFANDAICQITGYAPAELLGRNCRMLQGPDTDPETVRRLRCAVAEGSAIHERVLNYRKDGTPLHFDLTISPVHDGAGRLTHFVGVQKDITRQVEAEAALSASEARLRATADNLPGVIFHRMEHPDGTITVPYVSPRIEDLTGYSAAEIMADPKGILERMVAPGDRRAAAMARRKALAEMSIQDIQVRYLKRDGSACWARVRYRPLRHPDGSISWIGVMLDVTDRLVLKTRLRQAERLESIGRLASGVAHEFNNALTPILTLAELSMADVPADSDLHNDLDVILRAARAARGVVQRLLAFSHPSVVEVQDVRFEEIVADAVRLLRPGLPGDIRLSAHSGAEASAEPLVVRGDRGQLLQVVINLLSNARQAIGNHPGSIDVDLTRVDLDEDLAADLNLSPGPYARFQVRDSGVGMDLRTQERIFEPFFTTKGPGEGTGLGLSVAHGILSGHKGGVSVRSSPGQGAIFTVHLPLKAEPERRQP